MAALLNRAQARDRIRRSELGITPPIDNGTGPAGAQPPQAPDPSNPVLNDMIEYATALVNQRVGYHATTTARIYVPAVNPITQGPQVFNLAQVNVGGKQQVNDVRRVVFDDGEGNPQLLNATDWSDQDRQRYNYDILYPSVPQRYWTEAYQLFISPSSSSNGYLNLYLGTGVLSPVADNDVIDLLPADYHWVIWKGAACEWWKSRVDDVEAQTKLQAGLTDWADGIRQIGEWRNSLNQKEQLGFGFKSYRQYPGLRRSYGR